MERREWMLAGRRLGNISRCNQWWLGDWVRYGTARWGEKYTAAARLTGYDSRSLANMASVASAFPDSRRRDNLTWSHHAAVASLEIDEQDKWLDIAIADQLSVADFRTELRSHQHAKKATIHNQKTDQVLIFVCAQCGNEVRVSREMARNSCQ
jgi:hypothetical protein